MMKAKVVIPHSASNENELNLNVDDVVMVEEHTKGTPLFLKS